MSAGIVPVAIVGAGGYTGAELVSVLANHPVFEVVSLFGSGKSEGVRLMSDIEPRLRTVCDLAVEPASIEGVIGSGAQLVFLATPHEVSAELAPSLLEAGITVIDLSGAFRLKDDATHAAFYGFERDPGLVAEAVYGLPERTRAGLEGAALVGCAGCYVTAATIPLGVLADAGAIASGTRPIVDAVSGVTGAGRNAAMNLGEVSSRPYGVGKHRHAPEIETYAGTPIVFQPQLGAFDRGILATIHAELAEGWDAPRVAALFEGVLGHEPFVRLLPAGQYPSVAGVRYTNFIDLAWHVDESTGHLIVFSALDNLVKGASGQAVQCANAALGLPETTGLLPVKASAEVLA